ncbi:MAG TPA: LysM peptidoglycan-binding domain-containing protein [Anaerolineales bacterium]|nr:LysM peptidoglycan-binding domain-containing protein [Anaerolineales bacterium]
MKRLLPILFITFLLLNACGQTPSLWGTYSTPTAESTIPPWPSPLPSEAVPASDTPSSTPRPTATFTFTPTSLPVETSTPLPTQNAPDAKTTALLPTFDVPTLLYYAQSGDTLPAVAARFNVSLSDVRSNADLPASALINPGTLLIIPKRITGPTTPNIPIIPDSDLIFSATSVNFDIADYIAQAGGTLSNYREYLGSTAWTTGAEEIKRAAYEDSINPQLLLAVLEYESHWVRSQPLDALHSDYPMGYENPLTKGLFLQLEWAIDQLSIGYYGWRAGTLTALTFTDGTSLRIDPRLNAGTVAVQYLFAQLHSQSEWSQIIDSNQDFSVLYNAMFGDPWSRGDATNPILPPGLTQPELTLPFEPHFEWSFTNGPHGAWLPFGAMAAIDLAPTSDHGGCAASPAWVEAAAPGLIVRSENGVVVEDLDGDGYEQTGWDLVYLHIAVADSVPVGTWVNHNDHIGHPACVGGYETGTHLHFVRKYNGEWIPAGGPIPMVLSGWTVHAGNQPCKDGFCPGTMTQNGQTISANLFGESQSIIFRSPND